MSAALTALADLSNTFFDQDVDRLLGLFSKRPEVTYAGSELGERATGPADLAALLTEVVGRDEAYAFDLTDVRIAEVGDALSVLAEGTGTAHAAGRELVTFGYRLTGVLVSERGRWVGCCWSVAKPVAAVPLGGAEETRTPQGAVSCDIHPPGVLTGHPHVHVMRGCTAGDMRTGQRRVRGDAPLPRSGRAGVRSDLAGGGRGVGRLG